MAETKGEHLEDVDAPDIPERSLDASTAVTLEIAVRRKLLVEAASAVYLVQQRTPPRPAWLRLTHGGILDAVALERFIEDAPQLGGLNHEGLARVYEAGAIETPGQSGTSTRPYLMLECAPGMPVLDALEQHHHDRAARIDLLIAVCDAIAHAHRAGVAHGCLDHDRVLWRDDGPPIVTDVGVALSTGGQVPTALAYRSPEIRGGGDSLTIAGDVYALGVLGYAVISGHAPSERELLFEATRGRADDLVQRVLDVATSSEPDARHADAGRLAAALREAVAARARSRTASLAVTAVATGILGLGLGLAVSGFRLRERTEPAPVAVTDADTDADADTDTDTDADADADADTDTDAVADMVTDAVAASDPAAAIAHYEKLLADALDRASEAEWMASLLRASATKATEEAAAARDAEHASDVAAARAEERTRAADAARVVLFDVMTELPPGTSFERILAGVEARMAEEPGLAAISRLDLHELLGLAWLNAGRTEDAYPHLKSAQRAAEELVGADAPRTMRLTHALADAEMAVGRGAEGEARLVRVLEWRRAHDGEYHPETLRALTALAARRASRAPFLDAEPLYLELLAVRSAQPDPNRRELAEASRALALVYLRAGRYDDAEALMGEVIATWRDLRGRESREALAAEDDLAEIYFETGRLVEAEAILVRTMSIRQQRFGVQDLETVTAMHALASVFEARGRPQETADLCRELIDAGGGLPQTHWVLGSAKSMLGASLTAEGEYENAERLLLEGYGTLADATGDRPGGVEGPRRRAAARLVTLYERWGRPSNAALYQP